MLESANPGAAELVTACWPSLVEPNVPKRSVPISLPSRSKRSFLRPRDGLWLALGEPWGLFLFEVPSSVRLSVLALLSIPRDWLKLLVSRFTITSPGSYALGSY